MIEGGKTPLPVNLNVLRVAVTAGGNGIGKVIADSYVATGARVFVCDVDERALAECGHAGMRADCGQVAEIDAFMDRALDHLGGLDVLVNNAGIAGPTKKVEEITPEEL